MTSGSEHLGRYVPDMSGIGWLATQLRPVVEKYGARQGENAGHREGKHLPLVNRTAS
jgi:hypothetical protein